MKKQILIVVGIVVLIGGFFAVTSRFNFSNSSGGSLFEPAVEEVVETENIEHEDETSELEIESEDSYFLTAGTVFVDVQGEVVNPGVFEVDADVRVGHLIALAGGLTSEASTRGLNQASRVYDEMVIFVAHIDDVVAVDEVIKNAEGTTVGADATESSLISLSTASALELQSLPGIGPALSQNIIAHREANGPFTTVDELTNVSGVGARILENIRESIRP